MAVIYIASSGIKFESRGEYLISTEDSKENLEGKVFLVDGIEFKALPKNLKAYKTKVYVTDDDTIYYANPGVLDGFNAAVGSYAFLIKSFLKNQDGGENILLLDGDKDAVIITVYIAGRVKKTILSNAKVIQDTLSLIVKEFTGKTKFDKIILNNPFYQPVFQGAKSPVSVISETEILEFAESLPFPFFESIDARKKEFLAARNKRLNTLLAFSAAVLLLVIISSLYLSRTYNKYKTDNRNLNLQLITLKSNLKTLESQRFLNEIRPVDTPAILTYVLSGVFKIKDINLNGFTLKGQNLNISGQFYGGYRNFTKRYNELKQAMDGIHYKTNYMLTDSGKVSFVVSGVLHD
ncbi:MAG: hypothetical protein ACYDDB_01245 [bacterium]